MEVVTVWSIKYAQRYKKGSLLSGDVRLLLYALTKCKELCTAWPHFNLFFLNQSSSCAFINWFMHPQLSTDLGPLVFKSTLSMIFFHATVLNHPVWFVIYRCLFYRWYYPVVTMFSKSSPLIIWPMNNVYFLMKHPFAIQNWCQNFTSILFLIVK